MKIKNYNDLKKISRNKLRKEAKMSQQNLAKILKLCHINNITSSTKTHYGAVVVVIYNFFALND